MANEDEDMITRRVAEQIKPRLESHGVSVQSLIPIMMDAKFEMTDETKTNNFRLNYTFFQQDLVICLPPSKWIPKDLVGPENSKRIHFDALGETTDGKIAIPLIICEMKIGANLNSHGIITYSHIAGNIKERFPWVKYNLVLVGKGKKKDNTLYKHGMHFDEFIILDEHANDMTPLLDVIFNQLKSTRVQQVLEFSKNVVD